MERLGIVWAAISSTTAVPAAYPGEIGFPCNRSIVQRYGNTCKYRSPSGLLLRAISSRPVDHCLFSENSYERFGPGVRANLRAAVCLFLPPRRRSGGQRFLQSRDASAYLIKGLDVG